MTAPPQKPQRKQFHSPKGMRDFYPQDMAVRRYIENVWRTVSINHGFDEVEGPTFENLELYTHKSGPGIASELFQVFSGKDEAERAELQKTGQAPFALRPEFTPTLARMVAAKANSLPMPIKWFAIPSHFRAERPQRGRLREFMQWNVDFISNDESIDSRTQADVEVIACAIDALRSLRLTSEQFRVRVSNRDVISRLMSERLEVSAENLDAVFQLIDRKSKLDDQKFYEQASQLDLTDEAINALRVLGEYRWGANAAWDAICKGVLTPFGQFNSTADQDHYFGELKAFHSLVHQCQFQEFVTYDLSIVRGLAYYTGTVFEIHEATGAERAIAGGGRYDNLIESFGGPKLPACGFGMGDVVLGNLLHDKGLLPEDVYMVPLRPDAFVIAADDHAAAQLPKIVANLRQQGFHIRHSYKTTRNVGKLLGEAGKANGGALCAIILGDKLGSNLVDLKDLQTGQQGNPIAVQDLPGKLRDLQGLNKRP
jgi:histidyl-tRNA synthetase